LIRSSQEALAVLPGRAENAGMAITPNGKTVLIAEDDAIAREGMAIILHREGYGVATAANGQEALEYLRTQPAPSLILLDMLMPVLDG
jgi:CheY-like chemotaxis protein